MSPKNKKRQISACLSNLGANVPYFISAIQITHSGEKGVNIGTVCYVKVTKVMVTLKTVLY